MSVQIRARFAVLLGRQRVTPFRRRLGGALAASILALLTQACATTPASRFSGPDPSDPQTRVPAVGYRSSIGPFTSQRPVEPTAWREQNERVAPEPKP